MHDPPQIAVAPGSPEALDGGCLCSVLLNRLADDRAEDGFVDPLCPLHGPTVRPSGTAGSSGDPDA